jgi:small subunit ribosomal protein S5e
MMHGRNNGKKLLAVKIVKHAFEVINLLSGENPIQVLVSAIVNGILFLINAIILPQILNL